MNRKPNAAELSVNPFVASASAAPLFAAKNPFAPKASDEVADNAPEGTYAYALVKSGPEVPEDECETTAPAAEIMILWGASVLHVAHLTPPRSFYVGEQGADFTLPIQARTPVLLVSEGGAVRAALPMGATGKIEIAGEAMTVREAIERGRATPCAESAGASMIELPPGAKATIEFDGFTIRIQLGRAGRAVKSGAAIDTRSLPFQGLSTVLHVGLLAAAALLVPPLGMDDEGSITPEQKYFLQQALDATAETQRDPREASQPADAQSSESRGPQGGAPGSDPGKLGSMTSTSKQGRVAFQGPSDNLNPELARQAALADAGGFGVIGLLASMEGDPNAAISPWGGLAMVGADPRSALGNMWAADIGEATGANGLTLTGIGEGGNQRGPTVGLDRISTVGGDMGFPGGPRVRDARPQRASSAPIMRASPPHVDGRLAPDVIQRVVRQNFGRYRFCYQEGLRNNPALAGRVAVRFVIGRDGAVSMVANGGSDLPDAQVVSCVVRAFYGLSFPQPEHGIVTVTYPFMFSPSN
jgi:hypothetical protein